MYYISTTTGDDPQTIARSQARVELEKVKSQGAMLFNVTMV